ncbi:MAG: hypothetical protein ACRD2D_02035 [Terriglobales bacterium]
MLSPRHPYHFLSSGQHLRCRGPAVALACISQPHILEIARAAVFLAARLPVWPLRSLSTLAPWLAQHPGCPLIMVECTDQGRELLFLADPAHLESAECLPLPLRTTQVLSAARKICYRRLGIAA